MKKAACLFLSLTLLTTMWLSVYAENPKTVSDSSQDNELQSVSADANSQNYQQYLAGIAQQTYAQKDIPVEGSAYTADSRGVETLNNWEGINAVKTGQDSFAQWKVTVPEDGLYMLKFQYYCVESRAANVERVLTVDRNQPFSECSSIIFQRLWKEASTEWERDDNDNDLNPEVVECFQWETAYAQDSTGEITEPFLFYFSKGEHSIELTGVEEPVIIGTVTLEAPQELPTYAEYKQACQQKSGSQDDASYIQIYEAEKMAYRTSSTICPKNDRSSGLTTPYDAVKVRLNMIGGSDWATPLQKVVWNIDAPQDGYYRITLRERQSQTSGITVYRKIAIDGVVPCSELEAYSFPYSLEWKMDTLQDENGEDMLFYLAKGEHRISMEAVLGDMAGTIQEVNKIVQDLNTSYRKIIMLTGTSADKNRNYHLDLVLPEAITLFQEDGERLSEIADMLNSTAGSGGSVNTILYTMSRQLIRFADKPTDIPGQLDSFKSNLSALATWILTASSQPLELDKILISGNSASLPKANESIFSKVKNSIASFLGTFYSDYNYISGAGESDRSISVWVQTGRDQAQIIRNLIVNKFTPKTGITVDLKLVSGQLLLATVSGDGPDVVLQNGSTVPVDYAARGAAVDLSQFSDFDTVASRFRESALIPFAYNHGYYALPETQSFYVLYYRTDIFNELSLKVPTTWNEALAVMSELNKNNLEFGIPASSNAENMLSYGMLLYQNGESFYNSDCSASGLSAEGAVKTFEFWTDLFISYSLPLSYNATNRFRTGEMPMLIADYTFGNSLSVIAPEIRGLWSMAAVPGIKKEDGTVDHSVAGTTTGSMLLSHSTKQDLGWEFLKWWTSADAQSSYGIDIENRLGASARYATANIEAFEKLPWDAASYKIISEQWQWVKGIPEVPGGYYTGRYLQNAFRDVMNNNDKPRDVLLDIIPTINDEISFKRQEFGLD